VYRWLTAAAAVALAVNRVKQVAKKQQESKRQPRLIAVVRLVVTAASTWLWQQKLELSVTMQQQQQGKQQAAAAQSQHLQPLVDKEMLPVAHPAAANNMPAPLPLMMMMLLVACGQHLLVA
jgi:hypothetical protein